MKLEKIRKKSSPGYPSFQNHKLARRSVLKVLFSGIAAAFAGGCDLLTRKGKMVEPTPPPQVTGKMIAPKPPVSTNQPVTAPGGIQVPTNSIPLTHPIEEVGDIAFPEPSKPKPEKPIPLTQPAEVMGEMIMPEPIPRKMGKIAPVKPPAKETEETKD